MPTAFGNYTPAEVETIRRQAERKVKDKSGRSADDVWALWCYFELARGRKPPLFCPEHVIREVRADRKLRRAGV